MMKKLSIVIFILFTITTFGQNGYGYGEGLIISKTGDSIFCYVELAIKYGEKVTYKNSIDGEIFFILANEIESILTPYQFYQNIKIGKEEELMGLVTDGYAKLFCLVNMAQGGQIYSKNGGAIDFNYDPSVNYVIAKNEEYFKINRKDYKEILGKLLNDCPLVVEKINKKKYKFDDIEAIINEYNSCF